jgi:DNA invertase Pin-like site-specific DNA recombinase
MQRSYNERWSLVALDLGIDTATPQGELMAAVLATFAQFERRLIGQRTKSALEMKRVQGVQLGRLDHYVDSPAHEFMVLLDRNEQGKVENLVPLTKGRVKSADFEKGTMVLDWTLDWTDERDE